MWAKAAHAALAAKHASATHVSPCILSWLLSGITQEIQAHPVTTQLTQMSAVGGIPAGVVPSKLPSTVAPVIKRFPACFDALWLCYLVQHIFLPCSHSITCKTICFVLSSPVLGRQKTTASFKSMLTLLVTYLTQMR